MRIRRALLLLGGAIGASVLLLALLTPALVVGGIRAWLWWMAREHNLAIACANVDAPLLRPAVLHGLQVRTKSDGPLAVEVELTRAEVGFNLGALFGRSDTRVVRDLSVEGARLHLRRTSATGTKTETPSWTVLRDLLADSFQISQLELHVEHGSTRVDVSQVSLSASELESGALLIGEIAVASPLLTKSFGQMRGVASWHNSRLTLGALSLTRGIDIDAIGLDLARLSTGRVDVAVSVDAFGGKLRADITSDERAGRGWNLAGSASGLSLAQMSAILAWREQATGSVRACKFTFRGDASSIADATASVWTEINQFTWRERSADVIMFGASLYNQRVQVEQVYLKQRKNQLTVSGDSVLPGDGSLWPLRDFTGHVSASIPDVDAFARLLGADRHTYSGDISIEASVGIENRQLRGGLTTSGELHVADAAFGDALRVTADVTCNGSTATIQDAQVLQGDSRLSLRGEIDLSNITALRVSLVPTQRVLDLTPASAESCLGSLVISPAKASDTLAPEVEQIEIRGGLFAREWEVFLKHTGKASPQGQNGEPTSPRILRLCLRAAEPGGELRLGIDTLPQP